MRKRFIPLLSLLFALWFAGCSIIDALTGASKKTQPTTSSTPSTGTLTPTTPTPTPGTSNHAIDISFNFQNVTLVFTAWLEDESGNNVKNLWVCAKEVLETDANPANDALTGDALPNWLKKKYPQHTDIDGVSGPTPTGRPALYSGDVDLSSLRRFRICFEVDRSWNDNAFFNDRPAFTYKTAVIDADNLQASYPFSLDGWMSNTYTSDASLSQQPLSTVPGYAPETYMTDISWIKDRDGDWNDMVVSAQATVVAK